MAFQERSYSGKIFRPKPETYYSSELNLLIIATPWGSRTGAQKVIKIISDYLLSARNDEEVTSPFPRLACLSTMANNLRIGVLLANNYIYRNENKSEYISGVELYASICVEKEFVWLQLGHPAIFLFREGKNILPLGCPLDMSMDLSSKENILPPLPSQLLGLDTTCNLLINSFRPQKNDKFIFLSRSYIPSSFFVLGEENLNEEQISYLLADDNCEMPFWLGILEM